MKLKPFGGLVLIKILPEESEASTTGGIIMPATVDQSRTPRICEIVAIGPEVRNIEPGSKILIPRDAAAMPLEQILSPSEDGGVYKLVFPNAIIAIITE